MTHAITYITPPDFFRTEDVDVLVGFAPAQSEPSIDAIKDPEHYRTTFYIHRIPSLNSSQHPPDDTEDLLGAISGAYTDEGLYIHLDVVDDIIHVDSLDRPWDDDNIEILIDPDENRNGRFDGVNDSKYVVELKGDGVAEIVQGAYPEPAEGGDWSRFKAVFLQTGSGYAVEFFFPWEGLQVYPFGEWRMGIEVEINDDDGTGVRESWITLSSYDVPNHSTDQFATAELWANKQAVIASTDEEIIIDGDRDEAYAAGLLNHSSGRPGKLNAPFEFETYVHWTALYDDEFLYFHFDITDSVFFADSENASDDDSFELFIGDLIATFQPLDGGAIAVDVTGAFSGEEELAGIQAAYIITDSGWSLEVKIDRTAYGLIDELMEGPISLDFQLYDDDDGDGSDFTLTWNAGVDPFGNQNFWGSAVILDSLAVTVHQVGGGIQIEPGEIDAGFSAMKWQEISRAIKGQSTPLPTNNVFGARWKAVHDGDFLYLAIEVNDNALTDNDGVQIVWSREVGITEDDVLFWVPARPFGEGIVAPFRGDSTAELKAVKWQTDLGYVLMTRISFADLGFSPSDNSIMNFDLRVINDRETEGNTVKSWSSVEDEISMEENRGSLQFNPTLLANYYEATKLQSGWYSLTWLGLFNEQSASPNWVYHEKLQWLYPVVSSGEPTWFYSTELEKWIFVHKDSYPSLWIPEEGWGIYISETGMIEYY